VRRCFLFFPCLFPFFEHSKLTSTSPTTARSLLNTTCVTTPDVTEGPYFLRGDLLRTDIAEDQAGIPLSAFFSFRSASRPSLTVTIPLSALDIGLIDINTCEPLENNLTEMCAFPLRFLYLVALTVLVLDSWYCNATGSYSRSSPSFVTPFEPS
jgi:hypothetical protein